MSEWRNSMLLSVLLLLAGSASAFVEELDDSFMETRGDEDIWLIKFYTPWCSFCRQLDPVWHQIGSELTSRGSPVHVGKSDGSTSPGLSKEFKVRGYPAILMLKKNVKYNYSGARTKEAILDFANRVGGPLVRSLSSVQLFQHAMSHHDVMFLYIGATSELKGNFTSSAEELIVHTYFFSASRDVLPKAVSLPSLPAVVVFKDGSYFQYEEKQDGDLKSWINRERFPNFCRIDSHTLYAMGESGKLVVLALLEPWSRSEESHRYKLLVEKVSSDYTEKYSRSFYFGYMEGSEYISGLVMGEVSLPSLIVLSLSTDGYFLSEGLQGEQQLLDFLDGVLDGSRKPQGGNSMLQRLLRVLFEARSSLRWMFSTFPVLGYVFVSVPFAFIGAVFYVCCWRRRNTSDDDDDDKEDKKND
ncbi:hypothetical protein CgunFtcFv8_024067 [Champsocephalus gunnari]|uniref:protein disulfide-isomerase n=1 Tax=Champsocephalus gunnari TaxID=52237 RepID=A0AAN8DC57_CHAGU|nr:hypothetical protein CgunFtcFv8_024067 [Champsocephalus gunnari]